MASTTLKPNGSSKLTRWRRARAPAEERAAAIGPYGADVRDLSSVEPGLDRSLEVLVVLNDPRDDQRQTGRLGDVDSLDGPFLGMDSSEEEEVVPRPLPRLERVHVDAVVNRRDVVEALVPVGVADRDVVPPRVVLLEDRDDLLRREAVDRGDHGRVDQIAVRERQEVEAVVDHVEVSRSFEQRRDMEGLPDLR